MNTWLTDSTSSSLLQRIRSGDAEAWRRLVRLYGPLVYGWCRCWGFQSEDAADVVQEVFVAVHLNIDRLHRDRSAGTFRGWLWTITRNKLRDQTRANKTLPMAAGGSAAGETAQPLDDEESDSAHREIDFQSRLLHAAVQAVRGQFEERTFQAFWRMTVDGQTSNEVGEELAMTPKAVRQAKYRVLQRLRKELSETPE